jgi:glycosyltransferase involved in cell wall biosynthesis
MLAVNRRQPVVEARNALRDHLGRNVSPPPKTAVAIFGPSLDAVSGVSTHVRLLLASALADHYLLCHFQVGREGRTESPMQRLARFVVSPMQLALFLARKKVRIVHINTSMDHKAFWRDLSYLVVARLIGRKVVTQFHSGSDPQRLFSNPLLTWVLRRFLLASDLVTVLSSEALKAYQKFDPRIKVVLVPNAIETTGLLGIQRETPDSGHPLKLLFLGRIIRSKGVLDAVTAVKLLNAEGVACELAIAGAGAATPEVKVTIEELGLTTQVHLLGPVFGEDKNKLWLESDIQLFPTYHNEGLPYSILESLAAGCVPITCAVAAIPDVMKDGVHGLFVPPKDPPAIAAAVRRLAKDRAELARMAQAGRSRIAENYTVDRLAARFGEIYEQVGR